MEYLIVRRHNIAGLAGQVLLKTCPANRREKTPDGALNRNNLGDYFSCATVVLVALTQPSGLGHG